MGMDAELYAIGKYTPEIRESLSYPPEFYDDTPVGATIITLVGSCATGYNSRLLAEALGVRPWQFEEHCDIGGEYANLDLLLDALQSEEDAADFLALRSHGFRFYYLPNG